MGKQPLSRQQKRSLDKLLRYLFAYFSTPEGQSLSRRLEDIVQRIQSRQREIILDPRERQVYALIRSKREPPPSIREITRHLGLKSSRSGFKVVESLIKKGIVMREQGHLVAIDPVDRKLPIKTSIWHA